MDSEHVEVRNLLAILAPKVAGCVVPLNSQATGNALYGLQSMSSEHDEVRIVLFEALTSCYPNNPCVT